MFVSFVHLLLSACLSLALAVQVIPHLVSVRRGGNWNRLVVLLFFPLLNQHSVLEQTQSRYHPFHKQNDYHNYATN